jgi:hypothetical protein
MAVAAQVGVRSRWHRVRTPTLLAAGLLGVSLLLHLRDPHHSGAYGYCPWLMLTGTYCPGCGGLRAVNDLTRGDFRAAASSNLLFVGSLPLAAVLYMRWVKDAWNGVRRPVSTRRALVYAAIFLGVALVFTVLRNLPVGAWLAP